MNDRIRDARTENRFFVDNTIVRDYGPKIGVYGIAVYTALCMHADLQSQSCFPSHATIAKEIGCSVTKVKDTLLLLQFHQLITWERQDHDGGGRSSNLYILLDPPSRVATIPSPPSDYPPSHVAASNNPHNEQSPSNTVPPGGGEVDGSEQHEPVVHDLDDVVFEMEDTGQRKDDLTALCPYCSAVHRQDDVFCSDCGAVVVWHHSPTWKRMYGNPTTFLKRIQKPDLAPHTPLEVKAVEVFGTNMNFAHITQAKRFRTLARKYPEGFILELIKWAKKNRVKFHNFETAVRSSDNIKDWEDKQKEKEAKHDETPKKSATEQWAALERGDS